MMDYEANDRERYRRLSEAQASAAAKSMSGESLTPPFWMIVAAALFVSALAYVTGGFQINSGPTRYESARNLWLADCKKPIEVCTADWGSNYTLRDVYGEKIASKP